MRVREASSQRATPTAMHEARSRLACDTRSQRERERRGGNWRGMEPAVREGSGTRGGEDSRVGRWEEEDPPDFFGREECGAAG
ncbi:hypothetical protein GUJ93_ZPchr0008g12365 [Zizania palustris]|uniref:Uncharacterized protein n=1 Tax=Zizania palustris TaxID=103762 RepID=A0A8J5R6S3_ZIZPA|nr:hypothetical protein GUJ93_ZPchr0008g12365 [Zizania palustris]